jgi:phage terminase large subunit-like protein
MIAKVIDDLDLSFYPIQYGMSTDEIKAIPREDIVESAMKVVDGIEAYYADTPYYVDMKKAKQLIVFVSLLKHTAGDMGGTFFRLVPFQIEFMVRSLCVYRHATGRRKHREAIMFIPRKNAKSELTAALALYILIMDEEKGKQLFSLATDIGQASIIYNACVSMLAQSPAISKRLKRYKAEKKLEVIGDAFLDTYKVLSSNHDSKDGLRASTCLFDELHAFKSSDLYDVMVESMVSRQDPMVFILSTAGYNKNAIFFRKLHYAKQVMEGVIEDDNVYLMDFSLDPEIDDISDEENWKRVNPLLGMGVLIDGLRDKYNKATHSATDMVSFLTKHCNIFTDSAVTWISTLDWNASHTKDFTEADLIGRDCYIGLDLSSTTDLTTYVMVFPWDAGDGYDVITRAFIPKDTARIRSKEDRVSYLDWAKDGYMTLTTGNIIDYEDIYYHIMEDIGRFNCIELAFDRWNATALITKLTEEGVNCVGFGQGYKSMSPSIKAVEALTLNKKLNHDNNPVLSWCVNNVELETDAAENFKISKAKAVERVDCAVALAMAISRAESFREAEVGWTSLIG